MSVTRSTGCDIDPHMISSLVPEVARFRDHKGRKRLNLLTEDYASLFEKRSKFECVPDFTQSDKTSRLSPRFDIVFADLGYNMQQMDSIEGLSYLSMILV